MCPPPTAWPRRWTPIATPTLKSSPARIDRFDRERTVTVSRPMSQTGYLTSKVTQTSMARLNQGPAPAPRLPPGPGRRGRGAVGKLRGPGRGDPGGGVRDHGGAGPGVPEVQDRPGRRRHHSVRHLRRRGGPVAITGNSLSFTATIGLIALIGIEIKNSILLVDFHRTAAQGRHGPARRHREGRRGAVPAGAADLGHGDRRACCRWRWSGRASTRRWPSPSSAG
jgi:hypothetical protein